VRTKLFVLVVIAALGSALLVVVASAETSAQGLPAYTNGWQKWPKINRKPFTSTGPLSRAHTGVKNVYASRRKVGSKYPNGTVIVKTIVRPGTRYVGQFAVMRKVKGRWRFIEYERSSARARYTVLAQGQLCTSCHVMARANDYVFTKR
jgi:Cytochrome P460